MSTTIEVRHYTSHCARNVEHCGTKYAVYYPFLKEYKVFGFVPAAYPYAAKVECIGVIAKVGTTRNSTRYIVTDHLRCTTRTVSTAHLGIVMLQDWHTEYSFPYAQVKLRTIFLGNGSVFAEPILKPYARFDSEGN